MIGKVVEGQYVGGSIHKLRDSSVLIIQTEDGNTIELTKETAISIDDVSAEYPNCGKRVLMVIWNDFTTSLIQIGASRSEQENAVYSDKATSVQSEKKTASTTNTTKSSKSGGMGCLTWIIIIYLLGTLLNSCDTRTETEKWEDSQRGLYEAYASWYGWPTD